MGALREWIDGTRNELVWIEFSDYATKVIGGAKAWDNATSIAGMLSQAQGLLKTDVLSVDIAKILLGDLSPGDDAFNLLSARLQDESRIAILSQTIDALAHAMDAELVLAAPSPAAALKYCGADDEATNDFGNLDDTGALYTDVIRGLSNKALGGIVFGIDAQLSDDERDAVGPVVSAAEHYDWLVMSECRYHPINLDAAIGTVVLLPNEERYPGDSAFRAGGGLTASFWLDGAADLPSEHHSNWFFYGRVPADAVPETVLSQRAKIT